MLTRYENDNVYLIKEFLSYWDMKCSPPDNFRSQKNSGAGDANSSSAATSAIASIMPAASTLLSPRWSYQLEE
ncbi:MAG: hypothetical protein LBT44_06560 [Clostridiales bacterium]|jgi:hypothetical protein|nr:hypothetical protein [Clostridiales bacterium]